jgi:hypothetical protein
MRHAPADLILIDPNPTVRRLLGDLVAGSGLSVYACERLDDLLRDPPPVAPGAVAAINLSEQPALAVGLRGRFPMDMVGQSLSVIVMTTHPDRLHAAPGPESFDVLLPRPLRPCDWVDALIQTSGAVATGRARLTPRAAPPPSAPEDSDWSTVTALLRATQDHPLSLTSPDADLLPSLEIMLDEPLPEASPAAAPALTSAPPPAAAPASAFAAAFASGGSARSGPYASPQTPRPQPAPAPSPTPNTGSGLRPHPPLCVQGDLRAWPARALLRHLSRLGASGALTLRCDQPPSAYQVVFIDGAIDLIEPLPPTAPRPLLPLLVEVGALDPGVLDPGVVAHDPVLRALSAASGGATASAAAADAAAALVGRGWVTPQAVQDAMAWQASACLWDVMAAAEGAFSLQATSPAEASALLQGRPRLQLDPALVALDFARRWPHALPPWRPGPGLRLYRNDGTIQQLSALPWPPEEQWLLAALAADPSAPTFDGLMERALDAGIAAALIERALSRLHDAGALCAARPR